jgi:hypothetical protein
MRRLTAILAIVLLTAGCSDIVGIIGGKHTLHIESTTSWSGYISFGDGSGESVAGTRNRQIDLGGGTSCWSIQKKTESGTLTAYAKAAGGGTNGRASTGAAYGVVSGCTGK